MMSSKALHRIKYIITKRNFSIGSNLKKFNLCPNLIKPDDSHLETIGKKWKLPSSAFFLNDVEPSGGAMSHKALVSRCEDARFAIWGGSLNLTKQHPLMDPEGQINLERPDILFLLVSQNIKLFRPYYEELVFHKPLYTMSQFVHCSQKSFSMETMLYREEDDKALGSVEVLILIVDANTRRVINLPNGYQKSFQNLGLKIQERSPGKKELPKVPKNAFEHKVNVSYRHTDFYKHVNNKECILWGMDGIYEFGIDPAEIKLREIDVNLLKESDIHQTLVQKIWENKEEKVINVVASHEDKIVSSVKYFYY